MFYKYLVYYRQIAVELNPPNEVMSRILKLSIYFYIKKIIIENILLSWVRRSVIKCFLKDDSYSIPFHIFFGKLAWNILYTEIPYSYWTLLIGLAARILYLFSFHKKFGFGAEKNFSPPLYPPPHLTVLNFWPILCKNKQNAVLYSWDFKDDHQTNSVEQTRIKKCV